MSGTSDATSEGTLLDGKVRYRQLLTGHRSGFEPVLLAAAIPARPGDLVLECGTGAGAALLCLATRIPNLTGIGLEHDPALAALAQHNFASNWLNLLAIRADATTPPFTRRFDHVLANPPWHNAAGTRSPDPQRAAAHHAPPSLLPAWITAMATTLKPAGTLTLILPAASRAAAATALAAAGHASLTVLPLHPRAGRPAKQIILQSRQGTAPTRLLPGLTLHDANGITPEAEAILRGAHPLPTT